jgi:hypothetical protein
MNDLILYTTEDGRTQIRLRAKGETFFFRYFADQYKAVGYIP